MIRSTLSLIYRNVSILTPRKKGYFKILPINLNTFLPYKNSMKFSTQTKSFTFDNFEHEVEEKIKKGEFNKAVDICNDVLMNLHENRKGNSPEAITCYNYLGQLYQMIGKLNEADEEFQTALEIAESSRDQSLKKYIGDLYHLRGMIAQSFGDYQKCIEYFNIAIEYCSKYFEEDFEKRADIHIALGKNYIYADDLENGRKHLIEALDLLTQLYDMDDPNMGLWHLQLGFLFEREGNIKESIEYKEKGVALCVKKYGENDIRMASIYPSLGDLYEGLKMYPEALEYYEKAYNIFKEKYGDECTRDQARILSHIGNIYWHLENLEKSYEIFQKCIKLFESFGNSQEAIVGTLYNNLGTVCDKLGNFAESIEYFKKSIFLRTNIYGSDHPEVAITYKNIGKAYAANEYFEDAKSATEQALKILSKLYGYNHPECVELRDLIEQYDRLSKNE